MSHTWRLIDTALQKIPLKNANDEFDRPGCLVTRPLSRKTVHSTHVHSSGENLACREKCSINRINPNLPFIYAFRHIEQALHVHWLLLNDCILSIPIFIREHHLPERVLRIICWLAKGKVRRVHQMC